MADRRPKRSHKARRERHEEVPTMRGESYDAAGDLPGIQLNDPDETYAAGVKDLRLPPKRRTRM
jgi:hypothetical protein